jgi:hypothetical protein
MDYPMFESWLLIHRYTLTYVDITELSRHGNKRVFNATLFPNLEFLRLSRWQMDIPLKFSATDSNLLGPKLKTFSWDFSINEQGNVSWCAFGASDANWLRELAAFAVSHKAALEKIEILFTPERYNNITKEMGYPWDLMDSLRDEILKPSGRNLVYNQPVRSKDEWLKFVRTGEWETELITTHERKSNSNRWTDFDWIRAKKAKEKKQKEVAELFEFELQQSYHNKDIRGYLARKPEASLS